VRARAPRDPRRRLDRLDALARHPAARRGGGDRRMVGWGGGRPWRERAAGGRAPPETLNRVGRTLAAELDLEKTVQAVTDAATELSGAQFGAFFYNVKKNTREDYPLYTPSRSP